MERLVYFIMFKTAIYEKELTVLKYCEFYFALGIPLLLSMRDGFYYKK